MDLDALKALGEVMMDVVEAAPIYLDRDAPLFSKKGQGNYVTQVDYGIEAYFKQRLKALYPEFGFVTEENAPDTDHDYVWVIDPIDGTSNYLNGYPFTVSLALYDMNEKATLFGIVYEPRTHTTYYAFRNGGSYRKDETGLHPNVISNRRELEDGIIIFGMPYNRKKTPNILRFLKTYYDLSADAKRIGPSSLDICKVASGQADLYFELDLNLWDYAAGALILEEAGGYHEQVDDLHLFIGNPDNIATYVECAQAMSA